MKYVVFSAIVFITGVQSQECSEDTFMLNYARVEMISIRCASPTRTLTSQVLIHQKEQ